MFCGKLFQWSLSISGNIFRCMAVGVMITLCVWRILGFGKEMSVADTETMCTLVLFNI